ncbi:MAG: histidine ammonia-lyase [Phycisphaerales bacterium]|nr:histidine ammonia-lyase [Phycisphaerales bacterium]
MSSTRDDARASVIVIDGQPLTCRQVALVARGNLSLELGDEARRAISKAAVSIDAVAAGEAAVYGVNTGFGSLSQQRIAPEDTEAVQRNLVRSHAAGVGPDLPEEAVRAMLVVLAASLSRGASGVTVKTVESILALLNANVTPCVPELGSVGASGDLAPLAHAALVLLGEGEAIFEGERLSGAAALQRAGLSAVTLRAKEGLALLNGTHLMAGTCALALHDASGVLDRAVDAAAMAIDACRGSAGPLDARIHELRNQAGQQLIATRMRAALSGSTIGPDHAQNDPRVQDPYSLRAAPQVLGAVYDALHQSIKIVTDELAAVTDNPLVVSEDELVSGANFHGMPLALAADAAITALCHLAGIAERRIFWALAGHDPHSGIPHYLSPQPGLHSGLMIVQYTAAAVCNELRALAYPASVGNISTSAGIEDYNSMGATSARRLRRTVELTRDVVAMELLVMAEAIDHQRPLRSGDALELLHADIRSIVPPLTEDRSPAPDIAAISHLIQRAAEEELQ